MLRKAGVKKAVVVLHGKQEANPGAIAQAAANKLNPRYHFWIINQGLSWLPNGKY